MIITELTASPITLSLAAAQLMLVVIPWMIPIPLREIEAIEECLTNINLSLVNVYLYEPFYYMPDFQDVQFFFNYGVV